MNDTVGTEELERLVRDAATKKGNAAGWLLKLQAKETLSNMGQPLAAEVLAGRERDIAMRKALELIQREGPAYQDMLANTPGWVRAQITEAVALLAAIPDGELRPEVEARLREPAGETMTTDEAVRLL